MKLLVEDQQWCCFDTVVGCRTDVERVAALSEAMSINCLRMYPTEWKRESKRAENSEPSMPLTFAAFALALTDKIRSYFPNWVGKARSYATRQSSGFSYSCTNSLGRQPSRTASEHTDALAPNRCSSWFDFIAIVTCQEARGVHDWDASGTSSYDI